MPVARVRDARTAAVTAGVDPAAPPDRLVDRRGELNAFPGAERCPGSDGRRLPVLRSVCGDARGATPAWARRRCSGGGRQSPVNGARLRCVSTRVSTAREGDGRDRRPARPPGSGAASVRPAAGNAAPARARGVVGPGDSDSRGGRRRTAGHDVAPGVGRRAGRSGRLGDMPVAGALAGAVDPHQVALGARPGRRPAAGRFGRPAANPRRRPARHDPAAVLTSVFLEELAETARRRPRLMLFFDVHEHTGPVRDEMAAWPRVR